MSWDALGVRMRLITFNLRFENERDGENAWSSRRGFVVRLVRRYAPSILGTQEGRWTQLRYLEEHLPEYHMHAQNRVIDETSQYPTLFVRKDALDVLEGEELWLSKTPRVHLSKNWNSAYPRMMSAAKLKCRSTGRVFWAVVTHLDHMAEEARYFQARLLADWVSDRKEPAVVMGDFNDAPGSRTHNALISERTGLIDTWAHTNNEEGEASFTHHGFKGVPGKARMDWILASRCFNVDDVRILRDCEDGRYPSDHFPVLADLSC